MLFIAFVVLRLVVTLRRTAQPQVSPRPAGPARWVPAHHSDGTTTRVSVDRVREGAVLESRRIQDIADDDPDYDARFLEAMDRAQARAALLASTDDG